jgi:signal transduction histidine kinase
MTIEIDIKGDGLNTDKTRLEIILKNLISNSFRYMDIKKPNPLLRIEACVSDDLATIKVMDNGIGIGADHLPKIFNMFYRAVEHSQGTGIGLFLVRESAKMLCGKILVQSKLGEWTTFTLSIVNFRHGNNIGMPESEGVMQLETAQA